MLPRHYAWLVPLFAGAFFAGRAVRPAAQTTGSNTTANPDVAPALRTAPAASPRLEAAKPTAAPGVRRRAPTAEEELVLSDRTGHAGLRNAIRSALRPRMPDIRSCLVADDQIGTVSLQLRADVSSFADEARVSHASVAFDEVADGSPLGPGAVECLTSTLAEPLRLRAGRLPLPDYDGALSLRVVHELGVTEEGVE